MSLRKFLKPFGNQLPTADEVELPPETVKSVNGAVLKVLEWDKAKAGKKRSYTTSFTPEDRDAIGRYASENGNAAAVKKFKESHHVGESTVKEFLKRNT